MAINDPIRKVLTKIFNTDDGIPVGSKIEYYKKPLERALNAVVDATTATNSKASILKGVPNTNYNEDEDFDYEVKMYVKHRTVTVTCTFLKNVIICAGHKNDFGMDRDRVPEYFYWQTSRRLNITNQLAMTIKNYIERDYHWLVTGE